MCTVREVTIEIDGSASRVEASRFLDVLGVTYGSDAEILFVSHSSG